MSDTLLSAAPPPSRRADLLIAASAGIILLCLLFYAGTDWAMVLYRLLTDGLLAVAWVAAAFGWGRRILDFDRAAGDRRFFFFPNPKSKIQDLLLSTVTAAALGLGLLSLIFLLLGLAGWLNFWAVFCLLAIGVVLALLPLARRSRQPTTGNWQLAPLSTRWHWLWLAVMPLFSLSLAAAFVPPGILWRGEPNGYDVVEYHLQVPREWYEMGKIAPLEHNVFSYMPMNVEMHYLAAMELRGGPWAGMYLAQLLHMAFIVLTVLAIYGFSGSAGGKASAILAAVAAAGVPWLALLAPIAYNEGGLLLFGTLSIGWAMRAIGAKTQRREDAQGDDAPSSPPSLRGVAFPSLLCGLFAGFACGTKLTAVPMILLAIPVAWMVVWVIAWVRSRRLPNPGTRNPIPSLILFTLSALLVFCPWLIRNQLWAGNPVFPELMPLLGQAHFTDVQVQRYQKAHSPRPDQRSMAAHLRAGWNQIAADGSYGYVLLPIGLLAGLIALLRGLREPIFDSPLLFLWLMLLLLAIIWIGFTHLQGRFFILAIPILALMIGRVKWGAWQWPVAAAILIAGAAGFIGLNRQLLPWLEPPLLGVEIFHGFLEQLVPPDTIPKIDAGQSVALVGDARAFLYPIPMSRLHYRTVFDVAASPGEDLIHAWLGGANADLAIVDPNELRRLTRTYYGLPPLPPQISQHERPFQFDPPSRQTAHPGHEGP
jgi:hypothetical protein